jgi:predicted DNA-binding transcriptional regulator AlpA
MSIKNMHAQSITDAHGEVIVNVAIYHGIGEKYGRYKLRVDGVPMWGRGTLSRIADKKSPNRALQQTLIGQTPHYQPDKLLDKRMLCQCIKTGEQFCFHGQLELTDKAITVTNDELPMLVPVALIAEAKTELEFQASIAQQPKLESNCMMIPASTPEAEYQSGTEGSPALTSTAQACAELAQCSAKGLDAASHKAAARQAKFQQELTRIKHICATGLDPDVDMEFIRAYFPTSPATTYRKIKLGTFPAQIKRGGRSVWLFSVIEAYRLGRWISPVNLENPNT